MAKNKEQTTEVIKGTPFYKKASFPWAIIIILTVFLAGNINGWNMRGDQQNSITREASSLLSQLKTDQK